MATILIVSDSNEQRLRHSDHLEKIGYKVDAVEGYRMNHLLNETIDWLKQHERNTDFLLLDMDYSGEKLAGIQLHDRLGSLGLIHRFNNIIIMTKHYTVGDARTQEELKSFMINNNYSPNNLLPDDPERIANRIKDIFVGQNVSSRIPQNNITLEFKDVQKQYESITALQKVNFNIRPGEIIGIVGHNGSGKSTLLKIASGLIKADSGGLEFMGKSYTFKSINDAQSAGIQYLSQDPPLFPNLTVLENIFIGNEPIRKILGIKWYDWRAMYKKAETLHYDLGIELLPLRSPVFKLSKGQQAIVGFLRFLNQSPKLLTLDEPTATLGYQERKGVNKLIKRMATEGTSILLVSHILQEIIELTDKVIILNKGEQVFFGETSSLSEKEIINHILK